LTQTPEPDPTIDTGTPAADSPSAPADPASNAAP
jgi:hypothetical protein